VAQSRIDGATYGASRNAGIACSAWSWIAAWSCPGRDGVLSPEREGASMRIRVDQQADALYLRLDDSTIVDSKEVAPRVILNYDARDQVVGIELLRLSKRTPRLDSASCASRPPERR
jgi:uncharacterized protein YuzE